MKKCIVAILGVTATLSAALAESVDTPPAEDVTERIELFNGRNLDGWYKYLSKHKVRNVDPDNVFSVSNGMIVISGNGTGCITTEKAYRNYRLTMEYRWAGKAYGARVGKCPDSGILFHSRGRDGGWYGIWKPSYEYNVIWSRSADLIVVQSPEYTNYLYSAKATVDDCGRWDPHGKEVLRQGLERVDSRTCPQGWKDDAANALVPPEKPYGEWNVAEVVCDGDRADFLLNGKMMLRLHDLSQTEGQIQIQSEGHGIEIRKVTLEPVARPAVRVTKPYFRWLFGGFGFHHSEQNFTGLMTDEFRDPYVLKTFAELSPSFARTYGGFADSTKEMLDRYADYYDRTFRKAGTTIYLVPGVMPANPESIDIPAYAEKVAKALEYLIKVRKCVKIRYYCITNELMAHGKKGRWFWDHMDLFKDFSVAVWQAFRRHDLDVKVVASDIGVSIPPDDVFTSLEWVRTNMNEYVGAYCSHRYVYGEKVGDLGLWDYYNDYFGRIIQLSRKGGKRYILGEFGWNPDRSKIPARAMADDAGYSIVTAETAAEAALCKCEIMMAAANQGVLAALGWSFVDYPDPFIIEPGDTPKEMAAYEAGRSGYNMDYKYNKWGAFRWSDVDRDYRAYPELYAVGHLVRLFRKGSTILPCETGDRELRCCAVLNPDASVSLAVINRGKAKRLTVDCPYFRKGVRRYDYEAARPPLNAFNDLQPCAGTVALAEDAPLEISVAANSLTVLTDDYETTLPGEVEGLDLDDGVLTWDASEDPDHRYYRVYRNGKQIASTVATALKVGDGDEDEFEVRGVNRWLNEGE